MSINSKAKRDARRKKLPVRPSRHPTPPIQAHAHLIDAAGEVIGGAGRREEEWVLILRGRVLASTDSAGMIIAMLLHTASLHEANGERVRVDYSATLRELATREADEAGHTLEEYLAVLEAERVERSNERETAPPATLQ